ncbi:MAG: LysM peptidoglycan-binding domain-containing protein [Anaerolineae bacterium]
MDSLRNLQDNIRVTDRLSLLALVVVIVMVLVNVLVVWKFVLPAWQDRKELTSQLASAEKALEEAKRAQEASPDELQKEIATAQATLDDVASAFLSDSQAAEALNRLYQYASDSQVEIAGREAQSTPQEEEKGAYDVRKFRLQANGDFPDLMDFLSRIEEAAFKSFMMTSVNITEGEEQPTLSMDITLYTSPYSSGAVMEATPIAVLTGTPVPTPIAVLTGTPAPTPIATPLGTPTPITTPTSMPTPVATPTGAPAPTLTAEEQLARSLHEPWAAKDWEEVIRLIEQILAINPDYAGMTEKLYAAHVNYGRKFAAEGSLEEAKEEFMRALDVKPEGGEARAELQALAAGETPVPPTTPTPQPQYTIHVVQRGENLYRISLRYGTTVQAIMAANGLTNYNIYVGQQLRIPTQ